MQYLLVLAILIGHAFLWIGILNRLHATAIPQRLMDILTLGCLAVMGLAPISVGSWWFVHAKNLPGQINWQIALHPGWMAFFLYIALCLLIAVSTTVRWVCYRLLRRPPHVLRFHRRRRMDIAPAVAALSAEEHAHHVSVHLPGNETLQLDLAERAFTVPRLPMVLDGLTVVHLSDFHFTRSEERRVG